MHLGPWAARRPWEAVEMSLHLLPDSIVQKLFVLSGKVLTGRKISRAFRNSLDLEQIEDINVVFKCDMPSPYFLMRVVENETLISSKDYHDWCNNQYWLQPFVDKINRYDLQLRCIGLNFSHKELSKVSGALRTIQTIFGDRIKYLKIMLNGCCGDLHYALSSICSMRKTMKVELRIVVSNIANQDFVSSRSKVANLFRSLLLVSNAASITYLDLRYISSEARREVSNTEHRLHAAVPLAALPSAVAQSSPLFPRKQPRVFSA